VGTSHDRDVAPGSERCKAALRVRSASHLTDRVSKNWPSHELPYQGLLGLSVRQPFGFSDESKLATPKVPC
jgi:hypothetical protein